MTQKLKIAVQGGNGRVGNVVAHTLAPFYDVLREDMICFKSPMETPGFTAPEECLIAVPPEHCFAVINCAPYHTSGRLAAEAIERGVHYLDLTEDVQVAKTLAAMADGAKSAVIPQCGLAPGVVSILAGSFAKKYDKVHTLKLRVGGLPRHPTNMLGYALTWNAEGLVNQYRNPATALRNQELVQVAALDDVEELRYDTGTYEAFNTSGGVGTLCDSFPNAINIDYKTIRYPGHAKLVKFLMHEMGLNPVEMKDLFERAIPSTDQDVVIIQVTGIGWRNGRLEQATYSKEVFGVPGRSALQMTTAHSVCAVLDMLADGTLNRTGFVKQEEIPLEGFMKNRFGKAFA